MAKSKIFLYISLSFLTGVMLASFLVLPYQDGNVLKFISGFAAILGISLILLSKLNFDNSKKLGFLGVLILFLVFGVFWYQRNIDLNVKEKNVFIDKIKSDRKTQGIIVDEPEFKNDRASYVLFASECDCRILIQTGRYPEYEYGDEILIEGKIKEPENFSEDFNWRAYLAKDNIYLTVYNPKMDLVSHNKGSVVYKYLYNFKNKLENIFKENLSEPHASLLAGITLGSRSGIPKDIAEEFKETGIAHIIALSGHNISIIAWAIMGALIFFMVSRNLSFWISVVIIILFVMMTGASASVVRAAVMGVLILIARHQGRLYVAANALIFAGAVMVFLNPKILKFDIGFQLSFLAALGLIILSPKLEEKLKNVPKLLGTKGALVATLSAQIFVLPLIFYQFGTISWVSPIVNILIFPAVPIAMFLGFGGSFVGLIFAPLSKIFLWLAWLFLEYIFWIVKLFS